MIASCTQCTLMLQMGHAEKLREYDRSRAPWPTPPKSPRGVLIGYFCYLIG